jgi:PTS system galactitol-specific IIB component
LRKNVKVLIVCGSGIATSTMVAVKVKEMLAEHGIVADIKQAATNTYKIDVKNYDLIVSTAKLIDPPIPMVIGISYIMGRNIEETNQQILKIISELPEK